MLAKTKKTDKIVLLDIQLYRRFAQLCLVLEHFRTNQSAPVTSINVDIDTSRYSKEFLDNVIYPVLSDDLKTIKDTYRGKKQDFKISNVNNDYGVKFVYSETEYKRVENGVDDKGRKKWKTVKTPKKIIGVEQSIVKGI